MNRLRSSILAAWILSCGVATAADTVGSKVDNTALTARVKSALIADDSVKARQIDVETDSGVVQLSGFVDSLQAKQAAQAAAMNVSGVTEVRNELVVREGKRTTGAAVDDTVIAARVNTELAKQAGLGTANDVEVAVNQGVVELSGFVASANQKSQAATVARSVSGVQQVRNNIEVKAGH